MPGRLNGPHTPYAPICAGVGCTDHRHSRWAVQAGDRIPSEPELCDRFNAARETVRRAVRVPRERGLIVTEWGARVIRGRRTPDRFSRITALGFFREQPHWIALRCGATEYQRGRWYSAELVSERTRVSSSGRRPNRASRFHRM
ncbi:GntR family transcriptional regulator [Streptomyces sp. A1-5]|nr:GntR family transcriptional regulator [Streptomyces sp. A1-5]